MTLKPPPGLEFLEVPASDMARVYSLYERTMKEFVRSTWGWDEVFQIQQFSDYYSRHRFLWVYAGSTEVGAFCIEDRDDHIYLKLIMIEPGKQRLGYGTEVLSAIKDFASGAQKPLRLGILKANPVRGWYERLGFELSSEEEHGVTMIFVPQSKI